MNSSERGGVRKGAGPGHMVRLSHGHYINMVAAILSSTFINKYESKSYLLVRLFLRKIIFRRIDCMYGYYLGVSRSWPHRQESCITEVR